MSGSTCSEILDEGDIELLKIHIKENPADMLTKVVLGVKFTHVKSCSISFQLLELSGARLDELRMT